MAFLDRYESGGMMERIIRRRRPRVGGGGADRSPSFAGGKRSIIHSHAEVLTSITFDGRSSRDVCPAAAGGIFYMIHGLKSFNLPYVYFAKGNLFSLEILE